MIEIHNRNTYVLVWMYNFLSSCYVSDDIVSTAADYRTSLSCPSVGISFRISLAPLLI